jgi:SH3 domain-containing YSC84-like protein 1
MKSSKDLTCAGSLGSCAASGDLHTECNFISDGYITHSPRVLMKPTLNSLVTFFVIVQIAILALASFSFAEKVDATEIGKRLEASANVLDQIMSSPDMTIPSQVLAEAKCIAVVPSLVKVALGVGGRHGKGVATCRIGNDWSAPGPISVSGGSIGLQAGGQAVDVVIVVIDENAFKRLLSSKFKIGADVAGSPGPVGQKSGDTDWRKAEILSYSKSHGVFAGLNLKGAAVKQDKDAIVELYGRYVPIASILDGKLHAPAESDAFLAAVRKYTAEALRSAMHSKVTAGLTGDNSGAAKLRCSLVPLRFGRSLRALNRNEP